MTEQTPPRLISAIFHTSFHPTEGNKLDWCVNPENIDLDGLEFKTLPSGLHTIDEDVVCVKRSDAFFRAHMASSYFSHGARQGFSVFLRQSSNTAGARGARLSSLGILLDASLSRPRPWRHVTSLQNALQAIHEGQEGDAKADWTGAQTLFDESSHARSETFRDWSHELSHPGGSPTTQIPYFLHRLGPSSITLFKFLMARQRILVYTPPPVKAASELCHLAVDLVLALQTRHSRDAVKVLGLITLNDLDGLDKEDRARGWIACTTDKLIAEKLQLYDLLIDLSEPRPAFKVTTAGNTPWRVTFTWTDIALWRELTPFLPPPPAPVSVTHMFDSWDNLRQFSSELSLSVCALVSSWPTTYAAIHLDGPEGQVELQPNATQANEEVVDATLKIINTLTTHALSQTISITPLIPPPSSPPSPPILFSPKDVRRAQLNPFSALDAVYFLGLARELAGRRDVQIRAGSAWEWLSSLLVSY